MIEIDIRVLTVDDLSESVLANFNRFQETTRVRYVIDGQVLFKDDRFVDDWDNERTEQIVGVLGDCIGLGGFVVGAFDGEILVGFASVEGKLFGLRQDYVELSFIHVSKEHRNRGIGKRLFRFCCGLAVQMGAKKLYIAAHPSVETQEFYQRMGCILAIEINQDIYVREPLDIQLEMRLGCPE